MQRCIVLIGHMGSGKTSVGKMVSEKYSMPFYDSDMLLEKEVQMKCSEYFKLHGAKEFRQKEGEVIRRLAENCTCGVIATGGGALEREGNIPLLKKLGMIIYLKYSRDEFLVRSEGRMGLSKSALAALFYRRISKYAQVADMEIDVTGKSALESVRQLEENGIFDGKQHIWQPV